MVSDLSLSFYLCLINILYKVKLKLNSCSLGYLENGEKNIVLLGIYMITN